MRRRRRVPDDEDDEYGPNVADEGSQLMHEEPSQDRGYKVSNREKRDFISKIVISKVLCGFQIVCCLSLLLIALFSDQTVSLPTIDYAGYFSVLGIGIAAWGFWTVHKFEKQLQAGQGEPDVGALFLFFYIELCLMLIYASFGFYSIVLKGECLSKVDTTYSLML